MIDIDDFEGQPEQERIDYVDELFQTLEELEEEYQWTQAPQTKLKMMRIAGEINDLLTNY